MSLKICFESQWCFVVLSHLNSLFIYIFHKLTKFFFFYSKTVLVSIIMCGAVWGFLLISTFSTRTC